MLNRLNNLKFVWAVMIIFLMTCLPGCKSVTSDENTGIEIAETLTKPVTVLTPKSLKGDFASPNSPILRSVDSFPMKEISKTIETRGKVLKSSRPQLFRYALLRESGWVVNSQSRKDEFKSRRHCGFFLRQNKKQPDYSDQPARLFKQNTPFV